MNTERHQTLTVARRALFSDDVATAAPLLDAVVATAPDDVELRLSAAWAHARLGEDAERSRAEHLARLALADGRPPALALDVLAHAALRRGDLRAARALFRRSAEADPLLVDARRGLRLVEGRLSRAATDRRARRIASRWAYAAVAAVGSVTALLALTR